MSEKSPLTPDPSPSLSFEEIHRRYHRPLLFYAQNLTGSAPEAEDIVQNAFVKLHVEKMLLRPNASELYIRRWLYLVVHNESVDILRRAARQANPPFHDVRMKEIESIADIELVKTDVLADVLREIENLSEGQRAVVERYLQRLSTDEIAKLLNIREQSVRNQWARAMEALRKVFFPRQAPNKKET